MQIVFICCVQILMDMNKTASGLTQGSLTELYLQRGPPPNTIVLQLLAFQPSENNPKEIILRLSDRDSFLDCLLVGSYAVSNNAIVPTDYSHAPHPLRALTFVRLIDYFVKIDPSKICPLRIIVRKIEEVGSSPHILGRPQEISQLMDNQHIRPQMELPGMGTEDTPIKIEEGAQKPPEQQNWGPSQPPRPIPKEQETLALNDIMNNKQGFFIGRLVRYKFGSKEAKDGPMSFLYLGFLDINGDMVRVHLAGRIAIRQSREMKRGKVYLIKGLQLFQGEKSRGGPQIRLREKDYKIQEIQNEVIKSQYREEYFRWEHEHQWGESELVDVVGVVEEIEERASYKNANTLQEQRDVVRLIVRNAFKTVKISFWADHINLLNSFHLAKKQPILLEDIKKKKTVFLDFMAESNLLLLDPNDPLWDTLEPLLPPAHEAPEPTNVRELLDVYEAEPFNSKVRTLKLTISSINWKWIIYKMCNDCKKKVERSVTECPDCKRESFSYRYNCSLDLSDPTGTVTCVAFDPVCLKLFNRTADQFSVLPEEEVKQFITGYLSQQFRSSIENKNSRLIVRSLEKDPSQEEKLGEQERGEEKSQEKSQDYVMREQEKVREEEQKMREEREEPVNLKRE